MASSSPNNDVMSPGSTGTAAATTGGRDAEHRGAPAPLRPAITPRMKGDYATKGRDMYRGLSASSVGLEMGLSVIIGLLFGRWLDGQAGTSPWLLILFTGFGMAAGMRGVLRAMRQADRIAAENEAEAAREAADAAAAKRRGAGS